MNLLKINSSTMINPDHITKVDSILNKKGEYVIVIRCIGIKEPILLEGDEAVTVSNYLLKSCEDIYI